MKFSAISGAIVAVAMMVSAAGAATTQVAFNNIMGTGAETGGDSLVSKFSLWVSTLTDTSKVLIQVKSAVNAGQSYFIGGIFIDDDPAKVLTEPGAFQASSTGYSSAGVYFVSSTSGGDLPQGNLVNFGSTSKYLKSGAASNGVNPGETAGFIFTGNYANVVAALAAGTLRVGIHVQGIDGCADTSDSYVTKATTGGVSPVPLPASALLLLGGVGGLAGLKRKKKA